MTPLFKKLNLKQQKEIHILNAPKSFKSEMENLGGVQIHQDLQKQSSIEFALFFVQDEESIKRYVSAIFPHLKGDAILWFAYPKMSSKKYQATINRDSGWEVMAKFEMRPVRQVSIDEDWSALRFRKSDFVGK